MIEMNQRIGYRRDELHDTAARIRQERELRASADPVKPEPTRAVDDRRTAAGRVRREAARRAR